MVTLRHLALACETSLLGLLALARAMHQLFSCLIILVHVGFHVCLLLNGVLIMSEVGWLSYQRHLEQLLECVIGQVAFKEFSTLFFALLY